MQDNGYQTLDTRAFVKVLSMKNDLISDYNKIYEEYKRIVDNLLRYNWKGRGASAFKNDTEKVKANITSIFDILKIMCDTLTDCKLIFEEVDTALGEYNRNP